MSSVKSESWEILRYLKSIFVDSDMLHFHPCLFDVDMASATGP